MVQIRVRQWLVQNLSPFTQSSQFPNITAPLSLHNLGQFFFQNGTPGQRSWKGFVRVTSERLIYSQCHQCWGLLTPALPALCSVICVCLVSTPRLIKTSGVAFHQVAQIPPLRKVKCEPLCHVSKFSLLEQTRSLADAESGTELSVTQASLGRSRTVEKKCWVP